MNIYMIIFNIILLINYAFAQNFIENECIPVNKLLGKELSFNCCSIQNITCTDGHITEL